MGAAITPLLGLAATTTPRRIAWSLAALEHLAASLGPQMVADGSSSTSTGSVRPGRVRPGRVKPGRAKPGSGRPGSVRLGSVRPGRVRPGSVSPGRVRPGHGAVGGGSHQGAPVNGRPPVAGTPMPKPMAAPVGYATMSRTGHSQSISVSSAAVGTRGQAAAPPMGCAFTPLAELRAPENTSRFGGTG